MHAFEGPDRGRWAAGALATGCALRLLDYAGNRSLWHDEAALALNLIERDARGLLAPLDFAQMAPPGFLLIVEAVTRGLGTGEAALRLVPLLASLAGLALFLPVARRALGHRPVALACALLALSAPLVHYAAELKQYGSDLTVTLAILWLALRARDSGLATRDALALGVGGAVLSWFSDAAFFSLAGAGLALAAGPLRRRRLDLVARLTLVAVPWLASFALEYGLFLANKLDDEFMRAFWQFSFLPFPPTSGGELAWLPTRLLWFFERSAGLEPALLAAGVAAVGLLHLGRRDPGLAALLVLPGLLALSASALELYPFFQRFLFFLVPAGVLLVAEGVHALTLRLGGARRWAAAGLSLALLAMPGLRAVQEIRTAFEPRGLRPVLPTLAEGIEASDAVWVYAGAEEEFRYYVHRLGVRLERPPVFATDWLHVRDPERAWTGWHVNEANELAGRGRVWLVFAHVRERAGRSDEERLTRLLDRRGERLEDASVVGGSVYLYDLPAR